MKKLVKTTVEFLTGSKVCASYKSIKGNKSGGVTDSSSYKHWRKGSGGPYDDVN